MFEGVNILCKKLMQEETYRVFLNSAKIKGTKAEIELSKQTNMYLFMVSPSNRHLGLRCSNTSVFQPEHQRREHEVFGAGVGCGLTSWTARCVASRVVNVTKA